jgi:uncharacterized protein (TIGR00375 family)
MEIKEIARFAKIKGLRLIGTGDFTHPKWLDEIRVNLESEAGTNLYRLADKADAGVRFMLTTEVCTIFSFKNETKKIHNGILTPSLETAVQINDALKHYGDLKSDGRPLLEMTAAQLVEEVMAISNENFVFPAHIWTPWFSALGAFSGFDSIEECYQDMTKHIHALETGLSSDPPMNWRLSKLDRYTLISNSDSHSFWPWRIGREANVLELKKISYQEVLDTICKKDPERFKFTIETDPAYGKYHWTGHRKCNVSLSPQEANKFGNICPVCHRKLTEGVEQRVEKLADRPANFEPNNVPGFLRLLPLSEIIATVLGVESVSTQAVWKIYNLLISKFGDEYTVLIEIPKDDLAEILEPSIADAILRVRAGSIHVIPGYDGVYGRLDLSAPTLKKKSHNRRWQQSNLSDFN